jgi:hypothetical protein
LRLGLFLVGLIFGCVLLVPLKQGVPQLLASRLIPGSQIVLDADLADPALGKTGVRIGKRESGRERTGELT